MVLICYGRTELLIENLISGHDCKLVKLKSRAEPEVHTEKSLKMINSLNSYYLECIAVL